MAISAGLLTGIGALAGGVAALGSTAVSAFGSNRPFYSLKQQKEYQQDLMLYQQRLEDSSQIAAEKRALQYSDPAFIKQRALAAGVNPSSLLGSTAANAVGSNVSIPGAPQNSFQESAAARVSHSLEHVADSALGIARFSQELEKYRDEREARRFQLDALRAEIEEKQLRNRLLNLDISKGLFEQGTRFARWNEEQKSWQRADKAFNRQMEESAFKMMMESKRFGLESRKQDFSEMDSNRNYLLRVNEDRRAQKMAEIQFAMNSFDLSQKQWERAFFDKFGYFPPEGMTPSALIKDGVQSVFTEPHLSEVVKKTWSPYGEFAAWVARGFRSRNSWLRRQNRKQGSDDRRFVQ